MANRLMFNHPVRDLSEHFSPYPANNTDCCIGYACGVPHNYTIFSFHFTAPFALFFTFAFTEHKKTYTAQITAN
ncbi:hypothetical protein JGC44_00475 [Salmonella enterica subsp. enterica serovar Derby]|nr:hypothetical protein [Citrobacter freundii]MBJ3556718.1 hypothetical protein [Salmonella enterica subsp. enterica serovar Derby]MBJ4954880.1 hypothetical protein [Salmonella enterica subsp. enterica serovar Goldcoast]